MSRDIEFNGDLICDRCGKKGAMDFMGDYFCFDCLDTDEEGNISVKNPIDTIQ